MYSGANRSKIRVQTLRAAALLLLVLWPNAGVKADSANPSSIAFIPQWVPQAQWAGYYVAADKGFYRQKGLEVRILEGGPGTPPSALLASGVGVVM